MIDKINRMKWNLFSIIVLNVVLIYAKPNYLYLIPLNLSLIAGLIYSKKFFKSKVINLALAIIWLISVTGLLYYLFFNWQF